MKTITKNTIAQMHVIPMWGSIITILLTFVMWHFEHRAKSEFEMPGITNILEHREVSFTELLTEWRVSVALSFVIVVLYGLSQITCWLK